MKRVAPEDDKTLFRGVVSELESLSSREGALEAVAFIKKHERQLEESIWGPFYPDGSLKKGTLPASAHNDLYKFTMLPVMRAVELYFAPKPCRVTFTLNVRDKQYAKVWPVFCVSCMQIPFPRCFSTYFDFISWMSCFLRCCLDACVGPCIASAGEGCFAGFDAKTVRSGAVRGRRQRK